MAGSEPRQNGGPPAFPAGDAAAGVVRPPCLAGISTGTLAEHWPTARLPSRKGEWTNYGRRTSSNKAQQQNTAHY